MRKLEELKKVAEWMKAHRHKTITDKWGRLWRFSDRGYEVFVSGRKWTGFQLGALHKDCLPFSLPYSDDEAKK